jgi:hypothetical protein
MLILSNLVSQIKGKDRPIVSENRVLMRKFERKTEKVANLFEEIAKR